MDHDIRFCTAPDGVRIAYALSGSGPPLVKAATWLSHLEFDGRSPVWRHWISELSRTHTLIRYDERGCGLSDWDVDDFSVESWVSDLETVVDAVGYDRFSLLGISQGGPVAIRFAARYPERVDRIILYGSFARGWKLRSAESAREGEHLMGMMGSAWGRPNPAFRQLFTGLFIPEADHEVLTSFNELQRISASPENAERFMEAFGTIDVTDSLAQVRADTLVLHVRNDAVAPFQEGRRIAAGIPGSRFVPLEGQNHILTEDEPAWTTFLEQTRRFLGVSAEPVRRPASGDAVPENLLTRIRQKKVGQWGLAYIAAAWVALEALDLVAEPWQITASVQRGLQIALAAGLPLTVVLAWYHGDEGRQRVRKLELVILALVL
ncbi:MAG: alpha/beta hydrolase, partial [Longimicrobiales bacterium]|nr:alpha/beta hydrolase [Longimicrobiales bacterium]